MDGTLGERLIGSKDERAVTPVTGVILMVAITVILAAVIAAFVMGIGPGDTSVNAGVQVDSTGSSSVNISITDARNADNIAIVDESGTVVHETSAVTGKSYQASSLNADTDFTIYAVQGSTGGSGSVDDAEAASQVGQFST